MYKSKARTVDKPIANKDAGKLFTFHVGRTSNWVTAAAKILYLFYTGIVRL